MVGSSSDTDDLAPDAKLQLAEAHDTATLSPTHARRLFVLDSAFPAAQAAKTYVLDGATGRIEGMFNQAYWPNFRCRRRVPSYTRSTPIGKSTPAASAVTISWCAMRAPCR